MEISRDDCECSIVDMPDHITENMRDRPIIAAVDEKGDNMNEIFNNLIDHLIKTNLINADYNEIAVIFPFSSVIMTGEYDYIKVNYYGIKK